MKDRAVALGLILALTVLLGLTYITPPIDDFGLENPFWNGLSTLNDKSDATRILSLSTLTIPSSEPSKAILFIIGPSKPFTYEDADVVKNLLNRGGYVVLMDDFGSGNQLLEMLRVEARFSGLMVRDLLFKERDSRLPRIIDIRGTLFKNASHITSNYATYLIRLDVGAKVFAYTTAFSYIDEDMNGLPDEDEAVGPFPIIAEVEYGGGGLLLISDSSLFINIMLTTGGNDVFLKRLTEGRRVYVDASHWTPSLFSEYRHSLTEVYRFIGAGEVKYALLIAFFSAIFTFKWRRGEMEGDEVKNILVRHPEWSEDVLVELKRRRDEVAGS